MSRRRSWPQPNVAVGRGSEAVVQLEMLVAEDPLRERRWSLLMLALYRVGRQADALRAFQRARRVLAEDAGLSPGPELVDLQRRILDQDAALGAEPAELEPTRRGERGSSLSTPADAFVGREREMEQVRSAVMRNRLVTIVGVGGMGKTRLATEVAIRSDVFVDGVWFGRPHCGPRRGRGHRCGGQRVCCCTPPRGEPVVDLITVWCCRRNALLILDNCEHVVEPVARLIARVLAAGPTVRMLATSREPIAVAGEHVVQLPPLGLDVVDGASDAVRLLVERARAQQPEFDPDEDVGVLEEICTHLDGMPLAIELAAARLRALSPRGLADRLDARLGLLTRGRRDGAERHRTLRATVGWSYDLLTVRQQRLFECLGVFSGSFGFDDAVAIVTSGGPDSPDPRRCRRRDRRGCGVGGAQSARRQRLGAALSHAGDAAVVCPRTSRGSWRDRRGSLRPRDVVSGQGACGARCVLRAGRHAYLPCCRGAVERVCGSDIVGCAARRERAGDRIVVTLGEGLFGRNEIGPRVGGWLHPYADLLASASAPSRARLALVLTNYFQSFVGDLDAAQNAADDAVRLDPTKSTLLGPTCPPRVPDRRDRPCPR